MLNLQTITNTNKLYELIMPDGEKLTLKLPTQKMLQKLMDLQKTNAEDPMEAMGVVYDITAQILNLNTQGKKYTKDELEDMLDLNLCVLVIQDYLQNIGKTLGE